MTALFACVETTGEGTARDACLGKAGVQCTKQLAKLPGAEEAFRARIETACGGDALVFGDVAGPRGLGYATLEAVCRSELSAAFSGIGDVAACVVAAHACSAERLFALAAPRARELMQLRASQIPAAALAAFKCLPDHGGQGAGVSDTKAVGKALVRCARAIRKAAAGFVHQRLRSLTTCADATFTCLQTKPGDAACAMQAESVCATAFGKLTTMRLAASVARRCASEVVAYSTLRRLDGANLDALADECASVAVSDLATFEQYTACLLRQHACGAEELLRFEAPRAPALIESLPLAAPASFPSAFCPTPVPIP